MSESETDDLLITWRGNTYRIRVERDGELWRWGIVTKQFRDHHGNRTDADGQIVWAYRDRFTTVAEAFGDAVRTSINLS